MKITDALLAEHLVFHNLFDHIESVAPRIQTLAEIKALADVMEKMLKAHSDTEEELFMGPLEHCFEQIGQREMFEHEHEEIDKALLLVQQSSRMNKARELLLSAVASSRRHFDKEERIVFPLADRILKVETLHELGQVWIDQRKEPA
jgi:hypothetical protein